MCRQDKLASVAMALVKRDVSLDDAQVQSLMHQLRHEGIGQLPDAFHRDYARQELVLRLRTEIAADPTLRAQRRAGLLSRLEQAHEGGGDADGSILHAVEQLRARAGLADYRLGQRPRTAASRSGTTQQQTRAEFDRLRAAAPAGRRRRASPAERDGLVGLPQDPATRHALLQLEQDDRPTRPVITGWTQVPGALWSRVGYDADSGRLEVADDTGTARVFRDVPAELADSLRMQGTAPAARQEALNTPAYRYANQADAAAAGMAVHCQGCGRFVGQPHSCPADQVRHVDGRLGVLRGADGAVLGRMSDPSAVRQAMSGGEPAAVEVLLSVPGRYAWTQSPGADPLALAEAGAGSISGQLTVQATQDGGFMVRSSQLRCDCAMCQRTGRCRHTSAAQRLALAQLASPGRSSTSDVTFELPPPEQPDALAPDVSTVRFTDDPQGFADVVRLALADERDGIYGSVPLLIDDEAFYGYGRGRRFGVEIEYVVDEAMVAPFGAEPNDDTLPLTTTNVWERTWGPVTEYEFDPVKNVYVGRTQDGFTGQSVEVPSRDGYDPLEQHELATARHGRTLYDDGLVEHPTQQGYGAVRLDGYTSPDWSLEQDMSVHGELVPPILSDQPESWRQLQHVSAAVRAHAGIAEQASAHVHMSAADCADGPRCASRLLELMAEYEDEVHRMANNPAVERDVETFAAANERLPAAGFPSMRQVTAQPRGRTLNFRNIGRLDAEPGSDHLEFRLFDASLQAGRMQAQIKLAAALTGYASRHRTEPAGADRPVGTTVRAANDPALTLDHPDDVDADTWAKQTAPVRELIDRLFRRDGDKRQIAALWAAGPLPHLPMTPDRRHGQHPRGCITPAGCIVVDLRAACGSFGRVPRAEVPRAPRRSCGRADPHDRPGDS